MKKILILLVVLSSCSVSNRQSASRHLDFYACNQWIDRNKDGMRDRSEYENIKNVFRSTETLLFVGNFIYPAGTEIGFKLFSPDGSLVDEKNFTMIYKKAALHSTRYSVLDLIIKKSGGKWRMDWYAEGNIIAVTYVTLID